MTTSVQELRDFVESARCIAFERVSRAVQENKLTRAAYVRFLANQYYLTKGVQKPLVRVAASEKLAKKRKLREFLWKFALEEESHYLLAIRDLEALGERAPACPLEASLWWAYFDTVLDSQPLQRLGATCVLENLGVGLGATIRPLFSTLDFLRPDTTRFLMLHLHEDVPHGAEVLDAIEAAELNVNDMVEVLTGARVAAVLYVRMIDWYFDGDVYESLQAQVARPHLSGSMAE